MANLILKNINKVYPNGFHAVHNFNLEIKDGEFLVLVGPSGCGKSTTLRMIAGLEDITNGEFLINNKLANQLTPKQRGVAMVFQSYALYPHLSVFDNIAFGLNLQGLDEQVIEEKVLKVAHILGLTEYLNRKPRELSGGQRQRVAVGRAIVRKVDIFLMDEPLSNLDAKQRVTMREEITLLHRSVGATTIYVTHDQTEAMTMADRIVVMKDGFIQQVGSPRDLYFNPANVFVAGFIGEPPMNFIEGKLNNKSFKFAKAAVSIDISKVANLKQEVTDGMELVLGFRPEAAKLEKYQADGVAFEAIVELTELLGDTTNVYLKIGENNLIIKVDPHDSLEMGQICRFTVDFQDIYMFDKVSGKSLSQQR